MVRSILLLSLSVASPLLAQTERTVTLGDRVRVFAPRAGYGQISGNVVATTPDVLSIAVGREATEVAVAREKIDRLFLSVATNRHVVRGAAIGGALGAGIAYKFGPKESTVPGSSIETGRGSTRNLVTGTIGGAALGALIGYFARTDSWVELSPRPRMP
jgi:hypothetical protein